MANQNFVVQNGITIGPLTIDAATGSISTTGNITTTGTTTTFINEIITGTEAVYGLLTANANIPSTNTTNGTFIVTGGVGISGAINTGANISVAGTAPAIITAAGSNSNLILDPDGTGAVIISSPANVTYTNPSSSTTTGAFIVGGGVGIGQNLYVGGLLNVNGTSVHTGASNFAAGLTASTVQAGTIGNTGATLTGTLSTAAQPSITSVGTLGSLSVSGALSAGSFTVPTATQNSITTMAGLTSFGTSGVTTTAQGNLTVAGNLSVSGNITVTGNVTNVTITGNSGQFFGNAGGFGALYAGISTGFTVEPNTIFQATGSNNTDVQINIQNINNGSSASQDFIATADNGSDSANYIDMGINSSTYSAAGFTLNSPNDGYVYVQGNGTNIGGNLILATMTASDIIFATQGQNTNNEVMRITSGNVVAIKGNVAVINTIYGQGLYDNSIRVLSTSTGAGNLAISGTAVTLPATGPGAVAVGSSTAIPVITTDAYGRVASTTTAAVVAPAGTLTGTTLASGVTASSLTSVGTLTSLSSGAITTTGTLAINAAGGITTNQATFSHVNTTATTINEYGAATTINIGAAAGVTILPTASNVSNIGSTSLWFAKVYGQNFYGLSTTAAYADLAENYLGDKFYPTGSVLMFGGTEEVTVASADTTRVAGIVSSNPAHLMNGGLTGPNVIAVALTGRVPCNVIGPVQKGDLMVSAGFGYAKVNNTPAVGTIIGKALQDFPIATKGMIEVVVGRF